ncbi:MAG: copper homeostasis protein CutC [Flavobacteriaceae bacterium]
MSYTLEICSNSVQSALNAQLAGAKRVELCDNLWESGTTPSIGTIKKAKELLTIPLFVLIRPRGGDFIYSDLEFEVMKEDIISCKKLGVNGIVSGVLNNDNTIDINRTNELIELSKPLPFTFHRAFDITPNLPVALKKLINLKADRVLTSGGKDDATEASVVIKELNEIAKNTIKIMPGGGINHANISKLFITGSTEFHLTGHERCVSPAPETTLKLNGIEGIPETDYFQSSIPKIKRVISKLETHFVNAI